METELSPPSKSSSLGTTSSPSLKFLFVTSHRVVDEYTFGQLAQ